MRVVVQRAKEAKVQVEEKTIGQIDKGLVLLVGISNEDNENDVRFCAEKIANLRIFEDETGKMNFSVLENEGAILSISQFTLYGDCKKGRRPNFMKAAKPDYANILYEQFNQLLIDRGLKVETGKFGAMMDVSLVNDGPVTLIIES